MAKKITVQKLLLDAHTLKTIDDRLDQEFFKARTVIKDIRDGRKENPQYNANADYSWLQTHHDAIRNFIRQKNILTKKIRRIVRAYNKSIANSKAGV